MIDSSIKVKQQRLLAVRQQEALLARESSKNFREIKQSENKIQTLVKVTQEQVRSEKVIEYQNLLKQKDYCLENMGKAQKQAEEEKRIREEEIRAKQIFEKEAKLKARERGVQALRVQQDLDAKRIQEENALKLKRAEILKEESEIAHNLAAKHREKQKELDEIRQEEELQNYVRPGGVVMYGEIDYSKTHFHNPVILKHDFQGRTAKEIAEDEEEQALKRMQEKEETKAAYLQKAEIRGSAALLQVAVDKSLAKLSKELEKIRVADGNNKIQRGMSDPVLQNRCIVKSTQDNKKKQQELERMYEQMEFLANPPEEKLRDNTNYKNKMEWESHPGDKIEVKSTTLEIPQPKIDESLVKNGNGNKKKNNEEIQINLPSQIKSSTNKTNQFLDQSQGSEEDGSDDFQISESEECSDPEVLSAKYIPKQTKPKSSTKKNKSNKKKTKKFNREPEIPQEVFTEKRRNNHFDIEENKEFKEELEDEFSKHLKIKKELEELKKFKSECIENKEKKQQAPRKPVEGPPSATSSQLSPSYPVFTKKFEMDEENFENTSYFPVEPKTNDVFNVYSKFKDELSSKPNTKADHQDLVYKPREKKTPDSSLEEEESKVSERNFVEELKIKYGIVRSSEPKPEPSKPKEKSSTIREPSSQESQAKDIPDQIFSERTLKLMKEIEEKYSLDKFNSIDEEEDIRYDLPLSKPSVKWEDGVSEESNRGKSLDQYIEEDDDLSEKYTSEEKYEAEESKESISVEQREYKSSKPDFESENSKDSEKFLYNKDFFEDIKNRYGITSEKKNQNKEKKEFSYKFDFEHEQQLSEEIINESDSDMSDDKQLEAKIPKKQGEIMDFSDVQGKSLADIFKERNRRTAEKIDQREANIPKAVHKEKTKDELMEIRKELLKSKAEKSKPEELTETDPKKASNPALERLGKGEKPKISKKEMHELTKKNYDLLPEVQRKKEEDRKKQEIIDRIKKSKEFEKVISI